MSTQFTQTNMIAVLKELYGDMPQLVYAKNPFLSMMRQTNQNMADILAAQKKAEEMKILGEYLDELALS